MAGDCDINGSLDITLDGAQYSVLAVDQALDVAGATINVTMVDSPSDPVVIATFGSRTGEFDTENLPSGWRVQYAATTITLFHPPGGTVLHIK